MTKQTPKEILEKYKKFIHGSEYDYHCKSATLEEHNKYMEQALTQALASLDSYYKQKFLGKLPEEKSLEGYKQFGVISEFRRGYNSALQEIRKKVNECLN